MFSSNKILKVAIGAMTSCFLMVSQAALDISQTPLLTLSGSVSPNLLLIIDDSGSMNAQYIYQYGGTAGGYGMSGPGVAGKRATCPTTLSINVTCTYNPPSVSAGGSQTPAPWVAQSYDFEDYVTYLGKTWMCVRDTGCGASRVPGSSSRWREQSPPAANGAFYEVSPDVNRMAYDPRVLYRPRLTGVGATTTAAATPSTEDFYVFFYKDASGNSKVWPGTGNDPTAISSYFNPYTAANALTNPDSALATGATALPYPQCVGTVACSNSGPFPKFVKRTDCSGNSCSLAEERQNYANWKKFHSNRIDLAKTGLGWAFQDVSAGLRMGWSTINRVSSSSLGTSPNASGVSELNQTRKTAFYDWLYALAPNGSTPLREALIAAGSYFSRADNKGPWADTPDPTSTSTTTLSIGGTDTQAARLAHKTCRRSYTMMMTDGYYNDDAPALEDTDYTAITQIRGTTPQGTAVTFDYNGRTKPYAQQSSFTTMADIAMKYWIQDLRPKGSGTTDYGLENNVPQSANNPSFWQNMGFYGVGLGIDGKLEQNSTTLANLTSGTTTWPVGSSDGDDKESVDDIWHATVNGRGRMLSARNADALADGVEGMLAEINTVEASQSGVAASTLSLTTTTKKYTPNYTTGSWIGNVIATNLDASSGAELCTQWRVSGSWLTDPSDSTKKHWYVAGKKDGTPDLAPCIGAPTSFNGIPSHTTRNIYAWNGTAFGDFNSLNTYVTSVSTGVASGKGSAADANLVNYLRGDQSNEDSLDSNGNITTTRTYRGRQFILGDIVNSTPTFIKGALNMRYDKLPAGTYGQSTYNAFVTAKTARAEGVLFAGANDGMLHGFRESTGAEVFAFVPRAVMPQMHELSSRSYNHRYYVDGTTVEADACLTGGSSCTSWTNLLLGTAGAGGKTVFALDVTSPMAMNAQSIKWEITPTTSANFSNLGHILTDVQTGLTMGGDWVAIFGNGYNGGTGTTASLFVVNLSTGAFIRELVVPSTIPYSGGNNGLGGVRLLRDDNQRIIAAYAGDLKGNMWKFDLSSANSASWAVGLSNTPLYKTADLTVPSKQPIMATPAVVKHPLNGYIVAFGTGKLFETSDVSNTIGQALYGIWDSVTPTASTQVDQTNLVQQTISSAIAGTTVITNPDLTTTTVALNYYSVSRNTVDWSTKKGWYINLPNTGQRVIYPLEVLSGTYAAVDTLSTSNISTNACVSSGSGKAWNYVIDMVTGAGPSESIFDSNGGISSATLVSGYENAADGRTRYIKNDSSTTSTSTRFTPLSTQQLPSFSLSCVLTGTCTSSTTIKRTWRQLFMR